MITNDLDVMHDPSGEIGEEYEMQESRPTVLSGTQEISMRTEKVLDSTDLKPRRENQTLWKERKKNCLRTDTTYRPSSIQKVNKANSSPLNRSKNRYGNCYSSTLCTSIRFEPNRPQSGFT